jgi:hypothetical protein
MTALDRFTRGAALAALLCLVTGCPHHLLPQASGGGGGDAVADSAHGAQHPLNLGSSPNPRGLIGGIFDRTPDQDRSEEEQTRRQSSSPFGDLMRHAYGPARQAYELPLQEGPSRAPRPPRQHRR